MSAGTGEPARDGGRGRMGGKPACTQRDTVSVPQSHRCTEESTTYRFVQDLALLLATVAKVLAHALVALVLLLLLPVAATFLDLFLVLVLVTALPFCLALALARDLRLARTLLPPPAPPPAPPPVLVILRHPLDVLARVTLVQQEVIPQPAPRCEGLSLTFGVRAGGRVRRLGVPLEERPGAELALGGWLVDAVGVDAGIARD